MPDETRAIVLVSSRDYVGARQRRTWANNYGTTLPPLALSTANEILAATEACPYGKIRLNTNGWERAKFSMAACA